MIAAIQVDFEKKNFCTKSLSQTVDNGFIKNVETGTLTLLSVYRLHQ